MGLFSCQRVHTFPSHPPTKMTGGLLHTQLGKYMPSRCNSIPSPPAHLLTHSHLHLSSHTTSILVFENPSLKMTAQVSGNHDRAIDALDSCPRRRCLLQGKHEMFAKLRIFFFHVRLFILPSISSLRGYCY